MSARLLGKTSPPALPVAPPSPLKGFMDALNNILRLFFNGIGNAVNSLVGENGGRFLQVPNALFFDTGDQALDTVDVGQPVRFNQTYLDNAITINGLTTSQITVEYSGVYNIQFTGQVRSGSSSSKIVYLWIARDGVDVGYSAQEYKVSGSTAILEVNWNFIIDLQAGSYIELYWTGDDIDLSLDHIAATSPHPGISSAVVAVFFISALPEVLPVLP
jgi:hypothetical protein